MWDTGEVPPPGRFEIDWRRLSRWCLLGTVVMVLWLMAPVAKCTFGAFRDTPLSEINPTAADPADADTQRLEESRGFIGSVVAAGKQCYRKTPLLGQEGWKKQLLLWFAGATLVTWLVNQILSRRRRKFV